jgi:mannose-6-phosphate isomerase-like protein (cupin superfamily)
MYHVISGRGVVLIDGKEYDVEKGSVVFIPGDAEHGVRCVGEEDLVWLYVFATAAFGDVFYRFSEEEQQKKKGERERAKL